MTPAERRRVEWIAEKVMGWRFAKAGESGWAVDSWESGSWELPIFERTVEGFDPLADTRDGQADAMEALEAWCATDELRDYDIIRESNMFAALKANRGKKYRVSLCAGGGSLHDIIGKADTLPRAIVAALCAATGMPQEAG